MTIAFVDTSMLLALAFSEPDAEVVRERLARHARLLASPLLDAEFRCACTREGVAADELMSALSWVHVPRVLTPEIDRVLANGYLRGADCWHLATALFVSPKPQELVFLTRDSAQREAARKLGFRV